jgi:hypothetical protein
MNPVGGARDCVPYASEFAERLNSPDGEPDWWQPYAREFPDWHAWAGVSGLLYARRPMSSPPRVVRSASGAGGLRDEIRLSDALR